MPTLLTGCYPERVGFPGVLFPGQDIGLHPDEITIADVLKGQGDRTKIVGKDIRSIWFAEEGAVSPHEKFRDTLIIR